MPTSLPAMRDDECPVPEALIGRLYQARERGLEQGIAPLIEPLSPRQRAHLAIFCYGRAHLRDIGFAIAARCDLAILIDVAGRAGEVIYAQACEEHAVGPDAATSGRRKITLATSILRTFAALDEDDDEPEVAKAPSYADSDRVPSFRERVLA